MEKVKILPEIPSIQTEVNHLKNEGINIIIALGHSGFEVDRIIAKEVEHIDLVVGGHSNTFLYNGNTIFNSIPLFCSIPSLIYCIALAHVVLVRTKSEI